jgi:hypothetical protein
MEAEEFERAYVYCLRVERLIPGWIKPAHTTGKVRATPILGLNIIRILCNAIIDPIERLDKFLKSDINMCYCMRGRVRILCIVSAIDFRLSDPPEPAVTG